MTHVYIEHTICLYTESIIINLTLPLNVLTARNHTLAKLNDGGCDRKCEPQQGGEETEDLQHQVKHLDFVVVFSKRNE